MNLNWRLFTDCGSEKNAEKVMRNAISSLGVEAKNTSIKPYHKGGYVCSFLSKAKTESWKEIPYSALAQAQKIGRMWVVSGNIDFEFSAWSNESSISGIMSIEVGIDKNA